MLNRTFFLVFTNILGLDSACRLFRDDILVDCGVAFFGLVPKQKGWGSMSNRSDQQRCEAGSAKINLSLRGGSRSASGP